MNKLEEILMMISRLFGVFIMCLTLLFMLGIGINMVYVAMGSAFEKKPEVRFYKSDFTEASKKESLAKDDLRPEDTETVLARDAAEKVLPLYVAQVDKYLAAEGESLFKDEDTRAEKSAEYKKARTDAFRESSIAYFKDIYTDKNKKTWKLYVTQLLDYVASAEKNGVEVFTSNKVPISSPYYSRVIYKFTTDFNQQLHNIQAEKENKGAGFENAIAMGAKLFSLFSLIITFLFVSVMFAVMRIEKKLK